MVSSCSIWSTYFKTAFVFTIVQGPCTTIWAQRSPKLEKRKGNHESKKEKLWKEEEKLWKQETCAIAQERKSLGPGPEGMGKIRGICSRHMPAVCGRISEWIGIHWSPAPPAACGRTPWAPLVNSAVWEFCGGWATTCVECAPVLCAVPWWGRGSAFNEIPLIHWLQALLVSHLQTALWTSTLIFFLFFKAVLIGIIPK